MENQALLCLPLDLDDLINCGKSAVDFWTVQIYERNETINMFRPPSPDKGWNFMILGQN